MKSVVITGASGFIGKALTVKFLNDGYDVYGVIKNRKEKEHLPKHIRIHPIICDFSDYENLSSYIHENIEYFVHLAWAGVSGVESRDIFVQIQNIKAACMALKQAHILQTKRFLFAGSSYQYRMESYMRANEEVFARKNVYGIAKQAGTDLLRAEAIETGIIFNSVLFTNVFGVGDYSMRSTNAIIKQLLNGEDLQLIDGRHKHDWTYIDDAVQGITAILNKGKDGKSYYVGGKELRLFSEIIQRVRDIVNPESKLNFGCYNDDKGYIDYSYIDLEELRRDTGFECTADFRESILKTTEWVKVLEEKKIVKKITGGGKCLTLKSNHCAALRYFAEREAA